MREYTVNVQEVHILPVTVMAETVEEAIEKAIELHRVGDDSVDFDSLEFSHINEDSKKSWEWVVRDRDSAEVSDE